MFMSTAVNHQQIRIKFVKQKLILIKRWQIHLLGPTEQLANKQLTGWEWMRHRTRWWEKRQCCRVQSTWEIPAERCKQTQVPSAYLHQSYQRRHGCNILPQLHLLLPGSTNSHSGLLCISAYSLSTWLVSGEEKRDRAGEGKKPSVQENLAGGRVRVCGQAAAALGPSGRWRWQGRFGETGSREASSGQESVRWHSQAYI